VPIAYENRHKSRKVAAEVLARESGAAEGLGAVRSSSGEVVPLRSAAELAEAGRGGAEYDAKVARFLGMLGCPNPAKALATHREQLDKMRRTGIEANIAAAIIDTSESPHRNFYEGGAKESPTGTEWEVIVKGAPPSRRGQILNMVPPGEGHDAGGGKIVLGGFYDDQEAAHVARAVTRQTGAFATFGPKNFLYSEKGAAKESCGCGGACASCAAGLPHSHGKEATAVSEDAPADRAFLLSVIREVLRPRGAGIEMAFVPDVTEQLVQVYGWTWDRVKKVFFDASSDGIIDLQPDSSHGRLTKQEKIMCLPGPEGTRLSWVLVRRARPGMDMEERGTPSDDLPEGSVCRPFTRVVRDANIYRMCMARAKRIGEIADGQKIYELVRDDVESRTQESFFVIKINFRGDLIDYYELNIGQQHRVAADIADIVHAVKNSVFEGDKCDGFAVIHNHPTGNASPSPADGQLTKMIQEAADALGITLLDHIVIGMDQFYSFTDKKLYKTRR